MYEVNTGRTALKCAIDSLGDKIVWVPYFYCPDIIDMLSKMQIQLRYYHIDKDFRPVDLKEEKDATIILVNYFGVIGRAVREMVDKFRHVIVDNAHAFFMPPIMREGVLNVYSCRKFLGVCDGAYLIGHGIKKQTLERDISYSRAVSLLKCIELGTNGAYIESKQNEEALGEDFLAMSLLTKRILSGIEYSEIALRRKANYYYLHQELSDLQGLHCLELEETVPYAYPLLLRKDIHKELVKKNIYVPLLWGQFIESEWDGSVEQELTRCIVPLPLDQRYSEKDLKKMVEIIREIFRR